MFKSASADGLLYNSLTAITSFGRLMKKLFVYGVVLTFLSLLTVQAQLRPVRQTVDARVMWTSATWFIPKGNFIEVQVIGGQWRMNPNSPPTGATGTGLTCNSGECNALATNIPYGALIGRFVYIDSNANGIKSQTVSTFDVSGGAKLGKVGYDRWFQMSINDDVNSFDDNSGGITVEVRYFNTLATTSPTPTSTASNTSVSVRKPTLSAGQIASNNGLEMRMSDFTISIRSFVWTLSFKNVKSTKILSRIDFSKLKLYDNTGKKYVIEYNGRQGSKVADFVMQETPFELEINDQGALYLRTSGDFSDPQITTLFLEMSFYGIESATWTFDIPR